MYIAHVHRWSITNKVFITRKHWLVISKCRKCTEEKQSEYKIVEKNGQIKTECEITPINQVEVVVDRRQEENMKDNTETTTTT